MTATTPHGSMQRADRPDAALLRDASNGDRDAFRIVFERHSLVVFGYLAARVGPTAAEDLLAETFVVAWTGRARFRADADSARPWLYGIATKLLQAHRAAEVRWQRGIELMASEAGGEQLEKLTRAFDRLDVDLVRALAALPVSEREVLVLVALGEMTVTEAARAAGISAVAARVRLHRARKSMQQLLATKGST